MTSVIRPDFLPYGGHYIDDADCDAVMRVLKSDRLTCGPMVEQFEKDICALVGARYTVACANGTAALHIASLAMGLRPGDKVIVPTLTFLATANAPRWCGAEIVFADVDPMTGLMTPDNFREALDRAGSGVRAVFPVHLAGHVCDMEEIGKIAEQHGIMVVEDGCHALGSVRKSHAVGSCHDSDMTIFSFHPVKTIAMGEGGAITTNDPDLYEKMLRLRSHGMDRDPSRFTNTDIAFDDNGQPNPWYYEMQDIGLNYRLTDIQCALGSSQLAKLAHFKKKKQELRALYAELLAPLGELVRLAPVEPYSDACWHLCVAQIDFPGLNGMTKADLIRALAQRNIGVQVHYTPVHLQPYYRGLGQPDLPGAMAYYHKSLTLPLSITMTAEDVRYVVDHIGEIFHGSTQV